MSKAKQAILRIELVDVDGNQWLHLDATKNERWKQHGFGTFLSEVQTGEVEITEDALVVLLKQPGRMGLQAMEFWPEYRLAWGSLSRDFNVPCERINLPEDAKGWVRERFSVC